MPEQYIITGTITPADGTAREGNKIQAFDRDLPSLERRSRSPQILGQSTTDAEGRFQITYTLEHFQSGEGISTFRRAKEKRADLTFRVFDRNERELAITHIEALNREFRRDQIIFNVPTPLDVAIFVDPLRETSGVSEYEERIAQLAPIIQDLPLLEVSDEDIAFISNELGLEQQRELEQRIAWLRRSTLLAQQTELPPEAFYGWGRMGLPADISELAAVPLKDLRDVLAKLASLSEDTLHAALLAAVDKTIIPSRLREGAAAMVRAVRRRTQKEYILRLRLELASSGEPLPGYTVLTLDADANSRELGTDVTDALGEFSVSYFAQDSIQGAERALRFRVRGPGIEDPAEVTSRIKADAVAPIGIRISVTFTQPTLQQVAGNRRVQVPDAVLTVLDKKYGIRSLADIRRMGGLGRIAELRKQDSAAAARLDALADLDRLSNDLTETTALIDHRYDSVLAIAETSRKDFITAMTTNGATFPAVRAAALHVAAKAQADILDQISAGIAVDFASGIRPSTGFTAGDYFPPVPQEQEHD